KQHNLTEQIYTAFRRSIAPGSADIARYTFTVPRLTSEGRWVTGPLRLRARLYYRPLRPDFAQWISEASKGLNPSALSPITLLAESEVELPLEKGKGKREKGKEGERHKAKGESTIQNPKSKIQNPTLADRFLDYGLGLLAPADRPDIVRALLA